MNLLRIHKMKLIQTSVSVHAMFVPQSRVMRDCQWLEENLGPLVPVEVIVRFDSDCELPPLERMELVRDVQSTIAELSLVDGTTMNRKWWLQKLL